MFNVKRLIFLSLFAFLFLAVLPGQVQAASQVATPKISPNGGNIVTRSTISLSTTTSGATIYYTINGNTPTKNSYKYSGSVDLQQTGEFKVGTYTVKAIAIKSGYTDSAIASATFKVSNKDQSSRDKLSNKSISVNKDDCWSTDKTVCTSFVDMKSATLNEIIYFAQACDKWNSPNGSYSNKCSVKVTGGTEAGHKGTGTCSHIGGSKFDMSPTSLVTKYIEKTTYFTYLGLRGGDKAPQYKWKSGGAVYAHESSPEHWDVLVGC